MNRILSELLLLLINVLIQTSIFVAGVSYEQLPIVAGQYIHYLFCFFISVYYIKHTNKWFCYYFFYCYNFSSFPFLSQKVCRVSNVKRRTSNISMIQFYITILQKQICPNERLSHPIFSRKLFADWMEATNFMLHTIVPWNDHLINVSSLFMMSSTGSISIYVWPANILCYIYTNRHVTCTICYNNDFQSNFINQLHVIAKI